ncbi:hypothetical protein B0I37DRAFT_409397 [Chaetomium sp. MPI-CAGE-AT-0009]|nr:hypothetical protein B0I37DRAFT_409397 [Chaetomium sp. MPI-CAGE-AT-0009]
MTVPVRHGRKFRRWGPPPPQFPLFPVDTGPTNPPLIDCARTDNWIERFLYIVDSNVPATSAHLKVAVLGTGIDLDHPDLYDEDRIQSTRSWVSSAPIVDSNGHGTHIVSTILSLTRNVDVYVAKISEGNSDTLESVDYVAEAIRVATEEWDVDMILIPFGLPRLVPVIQDEIDKAIYRKKIIFAAASDNGANTGRSYPSNQPGVICVHSADGLVNASNFNPTSLAAMDNFCVPGEHIDAAWPSPSPTTQLGGTRRMSGSATATSVAVAIAALMIAFLSNNMPEEECPVRLKSYAGIRAVFRSLSEQRNGGYDLVNPVRAFGLGTLQDLEMIVGQAIDEAASTSEDPTNDGNSGADLLYVVEGLSEPTIKELRKLLPSLPDAFISAHLCDSLAQIDSALDEDLPFFAKWSHVAAQRKEVWLREKKLRTSKSPFNVDDVDPAASRLDHDRYDHVTEPQRSYHPIYEFDIDVPIYIKERLSQKATAVIANKSCKGKDIEGQPEHDIIEEERPCNRGPKSTTKMYVQDMLMHVAYESISFYHGNEGDKLRGILVFDQPRQYRITEVHYNLMAGGKIVNKPGQAEHTFQDDSSYLEKFISKIQTADMVPHRNTTVEALTTTIMEIVVEDQRKLLASISKALDDIELSMSKDANTPQSWRDFPPRWRNHFFHQSETIAYFLSRVPEFSATSPSTSCTPALIRALERAQRQLEAAMRRLEGTYQVLMSSMSILESERAIEQAEVVTTLTNLAFFFIPLTFVSGLFGMNLVEFDQKLTVGMWVGISLGVTAAAYFIRFRRPLAIAVYQTPHTIRRMRWDMLVARIRRWVQVLRWLPVELTTFVFFALLGVAVWLAATKPATDEAKIGITASLQVVTQLLDRGRLSFNKLYLLGRTQLIVKAALFIGAGVAVWAVSTSALPVDARIGLALVIFRFPSFAIWTWAESTPPSRMDSSYRLDLMYHSFVQLPAHPIWFDAARVAFCSALGFALWELLTSSISTGVSAKLGLGVAFYLSYYVAIWFLKCIEENIEI